MNIKPQACANLEELFKYGEMGNIEGLSPELARYVIENYDLAEPEPEEGLEDLARVVDEMNDCFDEIIDIAKRAKE